MAYQIKVGSNLDILPTLPDNSVDSIVTDPPYELGFMGKSWDASGIAYNVTLWRECLRVLKPGGHLLAFSGSRTYHRMACAIEDAGFEIRDQMMWVYGSGFPKSLNVSKSLDKHAGVKGHDHVGFNTAGLGAGYKTSNWNKFRSDHPDYVKPIPITDESKKWDGWGTALKPAHEPIVLARKPLDGTVAQNVLKWGVGGLNVDGCRVGTDGGCSIAGINRRGGVMVNCYSDGLNGDFSKPVPGLGRWPANFIHDGSDEIIELMPVAARFFYCAKASGKDRDDGCDHLETKEKPAHMLKNNGTGDSSMGHGFQPTQRKNTHPTVKPTDLMTYLCRLVTPPNGTILDPFTGSGSTGRGAILSGFNFIGIELSAEYAQIAEARINAVAQL